MKSGLAPAVPPPKPTPGKERKLKGTEAEMIRPLPRLFLNHMDAWQVALIITALALLLHQAVTPAALWLLVVMGSGYWLAFALNDYYDAPEDALDPQKACRNFFVTASLRVRHIWWLLFALVLLAQGRYFISLGWRGLLVGSLSMLVMWAYSAPPLRLKCRPGWDLLTHALFVETYPYAATLILINATWTWRDGVILGIVCLASLTAQIEQQVRDYAIDAQAGQTAVVRWGRSWARRWLKVGTAVLITFTLINVFRGLFPPFLLPIGLISLPALFHRFLRPPQHHRSERLVLLSTTMAFVYFTAVFLYTWFTQ